MEVSTDPSPNGLSRPGHRPPGWWKRAVVYQIYPRSFADSDGDGVGDLGGILARIDHLEHLGVDAVWLSPICRSPQVDNGYDVSDYRTIDPLFGTLDEFDELVEQLHGRGIRLIVDIVVNHTSDRHPWFLDSRSSQRAERRNWYHWRPPRPGTVGGEPGAEPNDWTATFGGPAWTFDEDSGAYYLHSFAPSQPDLNWEEPAVREAVYDMLRWWADRGVDGFRFDVINLIAKPSDFVAGRSGPASGSAVSAFANGTRLHEFLAEMHGAVGFDERGLVTIGEMPELTVEVAARVSDPTRRELSMAFGFEHVEIGHLDGGTKWDARPIDLAEVKRSLARWQDGLAGVGWNSLYLGNHDQPRSVSRFGDDTDPHRVNSAKTLATVLLCHRGTPFIYQGDEIGMTNVAFPSIDSYVDIESANYRAEALAAGTDPTEIARTLASTSRDHARTPMHWSAADHAGFTTGRPWLPVDPNHVAINVEAATADPDSILHHYRSLIDLRARHPSLTDGDFQLLLEYHRAIWAFTRSTDRDTILVVANVSSSPARLPTDGLPAHGRGRTLLATNRGNDPSMLRPWESFVVALPGGS
ncbi:MAG: alpha-glucosidase [Actinomycetota bacterium]